MNHRHRHEKLRISVKVPSIELMNQLHARALPWTWLVLMEMLGCTGFTLPRRCCTHTRQGVRLPAIDGSQHDPSETMQYLGWDSLFCKFCLPIWRIRNFDPRPRILNHTCCWICSRPQKARQKSWWTFLGPRHWTFETSKFEDVKRSISCRTVLFTEKGLNQIQIHQRRLSFPKSSSPNPPVVPPSPPFPHSFAPLKRNSFA